MNLINKKDNIFIAGNTGMVGSAVKRCLKNNGYTNLLLPSRQDLDLLNNRSVEKWFNENNPQVVILAAAKVGGIEANSKYPADFILENENKPQMPLWIIVLKKKALQKYLKPTLQGKLIE